MAITLVTGLPGHGKTLYTLARLKPIAEAEGRPVFHASGKTGGGIPGLAIDGWQFQKPEEWYDLPANSYMVIDECQKVFPIRPRSSAVPKHVEELETHRHGGLDLFLITQHPMLVDTNVRKLVDRHFHVVRTFGLKRATVYEFPSGIQDSPEKNKSKNGVVRHEWAYPKKAFSWYKSAEVHTVKARLPAKVWIFAVFALLVPLLIWACYQRLVVHHGQSATAGAAQAASGATGGGVRVVAPRQTDAKLAGDYLASMRPRIVGLAFTAPAFDALTKPVEAPYPSVCAYSPDFPCRCWSQRGFRLEVPEMLCKQLAREPMDPYWLRRGPLGFERGQVEAADRSVSSPSPVGRPAQLSVEQASAQ
jgi:zona occludens toxin